MTHASLSRIERGKQPYSQPILEALAAALNCQPRDLLRPPQATQKLDALLLGMSEKQHTKAMRVLQSMFTDESE